MRNFKDKPEGKELQITEWNAAATHDDVLIELVYEGEGHTGPYDAESADDEPLMVMRCWRWNYKRSVWEAARHGHWLTGVPATSTKAELDRALKYLLDRLYYAVSVDDAKSLCKSLSYISPAWYMPHLQRADDERRAELTVVADAVAATNDAPAGTGTAVMRVNGVETPVPEASGDYDVDLTVQAEVDLLDTPYQPESPDSYLD
jgi:hypothetical protein